MQPINFFYVKVINVGLVIQSDIRDHTPETPAGAYGCSILIVIFAIFEDALTYHKQNKQLFRVRLKRVNSCIP